MAKRRIFKMTEAQLKEFDSSFSYMGNPEDKDVPHFSGNSRVGATGTLDGEQYGEPTTTDDVADTMTNTYYHSGLNYYGAPQYSDMNEDFLLGNGQDDDDANDPAKSIPSNIKRPLDNFVSAMRLSNPSPEQRASIFNQIMQVIGLDKIPSTDRMQFGKDINNPNIFKNSNNGKVQVNSGVARKEPEI